MQTAACNARGTLTSLSLHHAHPHACSRCRRGRKRVTGRRVGGALTGWRRRCGVRGVVLRARVSVSTTRGGTPMLVPVTPEKARHPLPRCTPPLPKGTFGFGFAFGFVPPTAPATKVFSLSRGVASWPPACAWRRCCCDGVCARVPLADAAFNRAAL